MPNGYDVAVPTLDEAAFGVPDRGEPRYAFCRVGPNGREEFITARSVPELVAVSPTQIKAWASSEIRRYDTADPSVAVPGHSHEE